MNQQQSSSNDEKPPAILRDTPSYLHLTPTGWIEDSLDRISESPPTLNREMLITEIIYGSTLDSISLFDNIKCILPGIKSKQEKTADEVKITHYVDWDSLNDFDAKLDPADILCEFISRIVVKSQGQKYFVVRLTGGLDSTGILLSLLESVSADKVLAITYISKNSSCNTDELSARKLCERYSVKLILLEMSPNLLLNQINEKVPPLLNMRYAAHDFYKKERAVITSVTQGNYEVFDGHGGDHIFCEVIPSLVIYEQFLKLRPIKAIKTLLNLSRLQGNSIINTLSQDKIRSQRFKNLTYRYFNPEAFTLYEPSYDNLEHYRRTVMQEALIENGKSSTTDILTNVNFPFTCSEMLKCGSQLKVEDSFNADQKRLQYRQSIMEKHGVLLTRTSKGHITGSYQTAVKEKKSAITKLIRQSELFKSGSINIANIEKDLDLCAKGVGGFSVILLRLITAELMLQDYRVHG